MRILILVVLFTLVIFSNPVVSKQDICLKKKFDSTDALGVHIQYLGRVDLRQMVLVNGKPKEFKQKQIYFVDGEYIKTGSQYNSLCFTYELVIFTPVDSLPVLMPIFSKKDGTIIAYVVKYNNAFYNPMEFEAIVFQGKKLYLDKKGKYVIFDQWIRNQSVIKIWF